MVRVYKISTLYIVSHPCLFTHPTSDILLFHFRNCSTELTEQIYTCKQIQDLPSLRTDCGKRVSSLMCAYCQSKKDYLTTLHQPRVYKAYSVVVGCNTNCSQTPKSPHESRPHGHDRSLTLCECNFWIH